MLREEKTREQLANVADFYRELQEKIKEQVDALDKKQLNQEV